MKGITALWTAAVMAVMLLGTPAAVLARAPEFAVPAAAEAVSTKGDVQEGEEAAAAPALQVQAPSVLLMEASTGQVIYEKGADDQRSPASVTKVMTLILIFDALEEGEDPPYGRGSDQC